MDIRQALAQLVEGQDLAAADMRDVMTEVMGGEATPAQIAGFLVALRIKGETIDEITAAVEVMRSLAAPVAVQGPHLVDIVGTGGDGADLFNVSTAAAFVAAAAGAQVAKHGNRSASSACGSSDLLEALGVPLDLSPAAIARCIESVGMGFMFAPAHHPAMRHAVGPRREMGLRTVFNMLGPMTNPAAVKRQLIGVYAPELCRPMAEVLKRLGSEHIMVVHAADGLDEISLAQPTTVVELRDGSISEYTIRPEDFGIASQSLEGLSVTTVEESMALIRAALAGEQTGAAGKAAAMIALNAGAAIYVSGVAATLADGTQMAEDAMASGVAAEKIKELVEFTQLAGAAS
ncbi:anthranilate phosphoribosyltransferase [Halieaceae bacterium IMCC14734]|uniref:Anthranilate phosphoribosyltransferase n=1 Tax=Candidatus Litorirhabdus singularis TaxID=2518993 RepID=A0ABT3TLY7_9GAMM|nr:anthranilate phosphoribosyltransferase [Candidatus Litorirhabdus singularis]MCX2983352.1 anthranilate phosphoribosyltransferase [Candidatus Litorirhabdus singularis]